MMCFMILALDSMSMVVTSFGLIGCCQVVMGLILFVAPFVSFWCGVCIALGSSTFYVLVASSLGLTFVALANVHVLVSMVVVG